jgi:transposase InsO family protein
VAFSKIMKTERGRCAEAFLEAAVAYYKSPGIAVQRVVTDGGSCDRSRAFAKACRRLELKHIRTKPHTPRTNGKAERFIQTSLREWAHARASLNSKQRARDEDHRQAARHEDQQDDPGEDVERGHVVGRSEPERHLDHAPVAVQAVGLADVMQPFQHDRGFAFEGFRRPQYGGAKTERGDFGDVMGLLRKPFIWSENGTAGGV